MLHTRTLYISDLDGTLMNSRQQITPFTRLTLNRLISQGMAFTVATARTNATVERLLEGLELRLPVVLMNGVCAYDMKTKTYAYVQAVDPQTAREVLTLLDDYRLSGFWYTIEQGQMTTWYENLDNPHAREFLEERVNLYGKRFTQTESFHSLLNLPLVYYSVFDVREKLLPLYEALKAFDTLHVEFYRDIYDTGLWYLEFFSAKASKRNGALWVKEYGGFDYMVGFGDNANDLPLFEACDEGIAPANALPAVKERACLVIGDNDSDGVARYLEKREGEHA
ncbi:MAG: HAD-IIB family hydrolase [Clostridia bacterium]|nr:HAD-IIB family hydrolase [Clostridia bacterium]